MEIQVLGRHALLFDDDAAANFVNSKEALVEWNSLSIDRYDVRHLISSLPVNFRRKRSGSSPTPDSQLEPELDRERYADLPSPSDKPSSEPETDTEQTAVNTAGYRAVPFSYGDSGAGPQSEQKDEDAGFRPSFSVPENLVQNLPPTEKTHQIIARTALFVSEHGGQSEIVLRVKQGDNPTFGFLMPHHHLHPYFRYLVDHPEILKEKEKGRQNSPVGDMTGGALSLLGSVYGDEDAEAEDVKDSTSSMSDVPSANQSDKMHQASSVSQPDEVAPSNEKAPSTRKASVNDTIKSRSRSTVKKEVVNNGHMSKSSSLPSMSKVESLPIVEPPTELKRLVDRIVEIVLKNGQAFEALLIGQDKNHGKFPFLLPSNEYHPYYLQVLERAQKSKRSGKSSSLQKDVNSMGERELDLPFNNDRKEKFKMVIGKSKKDTVEQVSKDASQQNGVSVDVDAAAAILQAATRGIKNPNLDIFSKTSSDGPSHGGGASSLGSFQLQRSNQNHSGSEDFSVGVPNAKQIAKTAAIVAAGEADSSEAGLTKEQKLKSERLKRAKMFAAMIKSKVPAPLGKVLHRASSSDVEVRYQEAKETKGSSVPENDRTSEEAVKTEKEQHFDNIMETDDKLSRKNRHYRSRTHEKREVGEGENIEVEEEAGDRRHSRKKHRSHRSSHHHRDRSKDRHKHRKRHASSKDRESSKSRHRRKHESASEEDDIDEYRRYKRHHHYHSSSEDEEDKSRRHGHKRSHTHVDRNGDDERTSSSKYRGKSRSSSKAELDEEDINGKESPIVVDAASREASVDKLGKNLNPNQEKRSPSQPLESSDVPDDLRAKIRAMLLATL